MQDLFKNPQTARPSLVFLLFSLSTLVVSGVLPAEAPSRAEPRTFTAKVANVRMNAELVAQGKSQEDQVSVTVPALLFAEPVRIDDVRKAGKHSVPEVDFLIRYRRANITGTAEEMLAFWHPDDREEKRQLMSRPEIFQANRDYITKNPGLVLTGLVFQSDLVSVMSEQHGRMNLFTLTRHGGRYVLTDRASADLELAIVEASFQ